MVSNVAPQKQEGLTPEDITTDKILFENGYDTHHYGKWHIGGEGRFPYFPDMYGYTDYVRENRARAAGRQRNDTGEWMFFKGLPFPVELAEPIASRQSWFREHWGRKANFESVAKIGRLRDEPGSWVDAMVCDKTIETLNALKGSGRPFMITTSFIYPHDPNFVSSPYYEMFDPGTLETAGTDKIEKIYEKDWSAQLARGWGEEGVKEFLRIYCAAVKYIDDQVGRLLAALEANGQLEHTVIVFTADHGDIAFEADSYVLATGSYFSQGLVAGMDGVREPLFGLDVACAADRGAWYDRDLFAAQPFELFGVKCDERLRGLRDGRAVENLYAIGAGLAGFNPVKEGCGAGVSMLTALAAAERILNE